MRNPRVALGQLYIPIGSRPAAQFQKAAQFTRQAVKDGADIVIFPEMVLGFPPGVDAKLAERALFSGECLRELNNFQALAKVSLDKLFRTPILSSFADSI